MRRLREWVVRVWGSLGWRGHDPDLEQELRLHLELAAEDERRRSGAAEGAVRAAAIRSGGVAQTMEALRDQRSLPWLDDLARDVRHGLRLLRRSPVFTGAAVVSLALGIGANTVVFSLADAVLLRPLPVREPNTVVTVSATGPDHGMGGGGVSYPNYEDLRQQSQSFDGLIAYRQSAFSFTRSRQATPEMRVGMLVSDHFFDVLGIQPVLGRGFTAEEGRVPGRDAVVVLGHTFWTHALGADTSIVDTIVRINGIDFTVVGVAPPSFTGMDQSLALRPAFFMPIMMAERLGARPEHLLSDRSASAFIVKGRLEAGVSRRTADAELGTLWKGLQAEYPDANKHRGMAVRGELDERIRESPPDAIVIGLLMTLVAIVLIIACANVANLMLGRARGRSHEMAIRLALGVSRMRLLRQLLTESLMLALIGGVLGLAVAYGGLGFVRTSQVSPDLMVGISPELDLRVLLFSLMATLGSAVLFGLWPAWHSLNTALVPGLKTSEPGETARRRTFGRNGLVVAQVALSMVLLVAVGILLDGFRKAVVLSPGFRTDHLVIMSVDTSFARHSSVRARDFYRNLVDRAQALPGIASVALTSWVPLDRGGSIDAVMPEGFQLAQGQESVTLFTAVVDEHYFATIGTELVRGRAFTPDDKEGSRRVTIVNEEFAKVYWPNQDPIGKRVRMNDSRGPWLDVVGLARTGKYLFVGEAPMPFLYLPFAQNERTGMTLIVETTSSDAAALMKSLREVVHTLNMDQPVYNSETLSSFYERRVLAVPLMILQMVGTIGLLGLTLALIGLYGLVAYSVARRTREIGIRIAIGAGESDVLRMVLREGFMLSIAGILLGGAASVAVARVLTAALVGLGAPNPATYVIVPAALISLTMAATYFPARQAAAVDPVEALKAE